MERDIKIIDENSEYYPDNLRLIANRPKQLYCAGDLKLLNSTSIAVIGSRKYTIYGKNVASMIGSTLAQAGVPVVSGLAGGIDTFAHEGVLSVDGGRPIAVLGTGIDRPYPKKNAKLYERVLEAGLIVSEYPPEFEGAPYSFPARNRIIAGLCTSLVVIEANFKSGSLITCQFAMDQGKTVYAVPGNINSQFSMGTNLLLRDGATPLVVIDDLIADIKKDNLPTLEDKAASLGEDERAIFFVIARNDGCSVDYISHELNIKSSKVNAILTVLEIKGYVTTFGGKAYLSK